MLLAHVNKRHINDLDHGRSNLNPRCCPFPSTPHALKPETPDLFPPSIERDLLITQSADLRETCIASIHLTSRLTRVLPCLHVGHPSPLSNVVNADGPVSIASQLVWNVATKGDGAACMLCDRVMNTMLSGEADAMDMDCQKTCWGLNKCIQICDKLVTALETSGRFPCVAAGTAPSTLLLSALYPLP